MKVIFLTKTIMTFAAVFLFGFVCGRPYHAAAQSTAVVKAVLKKVGIDIAVQAGLDGAVATGMHGYTEGEFKPQLGDSPQVFGQELPKITEFTPLVAEAIDILNIIEAEVTAIDAYYREYMEQKRDEALRQALARLRNQPGYDDRLRLARGEWFYQHLQTYIDLLKKLREARSAAEQERIRAEINRFMVFVNNLAWQTGWNNVDISFLSPKEQEVIRRQFFALPEAEGR